MLRNNLLTAIVSFALGALIMFALRTPVTTAALHTAQPDLSDYALRHPGMTISVPAPDLSDYALRHPGVKTGIEEIADRSDYALRHPGVKIRFEAAPDLSDYGLRHPGVVPSAAQ